MILAKRHSICATVVHALAVVALGLALGALPLRAVTHGVLKKAAPPTLTVGVALHKERVAITASSGLVVYETSTGNRLFAKLKPQPLVFSVHPKGFLIEGFGARSHVRVEPLKGGYLSVDGVPYRGAFVVDEDRFGKISVINVIDVESYLYGVIKSEMLISAPIEALKAQAVIARTFAIKYKERYSKIRGFGLTADTSSQMYSGIRGEDPRATRAVNATRGQVVTYQGKLVQCYYHSACGGYTLDNNNSWGGSPLPYLRGVKCGYCADTPNFMWRVSLSFENIQKALLEKGHKVSTIKRISTETCPTSGRAIVIIVESDRGTVRLLSNQFRLALGTSLVKSAFFTCPQQMVTCRLPTPPKQSPPAEELKMRSLIGDYLSEVNAPCELVLEGSGLGHGVGLCQSGAGTLAEIERKKFDEILTFYYLGTKLNRLY